MKIKVFYIKEEEHELPDNVTADNISHLVYEVMKNDSYYGHGNELLGKSIVSNFIPIVIEAEDYNKISALLDFIPTSQYPSKVRRAEEIGMINNMRIFVEPFKKKCLCGDVCHENK